MINVRNVTVVAVAFATVIACGPPVIQSFVVSPHRGCPGTVGMATWVVTNDPTGVTYSVNPGGSVASQPASGSGQFSIRAPQVVVSIDVAGSGVNQAQTVTAIVGDEPLPSNGTPICSNGTVTISGTLVGEDLAHLVTAAAYVTNSDGRTLTIQHNGHVQVWNGSTGTLNPFQGDPVVGPWILSYPLMAGEMCGVGSTNPTHPPPTFQLTVVATCGTPGSTTSDAGPPPPPHDGGTDAATSCGLLNEPCCMGTTCNAANLNCVTNPASPSAPKLCAECGMNDNDPCCTVTTLTHEPCSQAGVPPGSTRVCCAGRCWTGGTGSTCP